jgi:hypothetical protein
MSRLTIFGVLLGVLYLLPWSAAAPVPRPEEEAHAKLAKKVKFPGYEDRRTTLSEALEDLGKKYDLSFEINERAFVHEGIKDVGKTEVADRDPIPAMNAPLETVLKKILARIPVTSGATYLIRRDQIEITTEIFFHNEFWGEDHTGPFLPLATADLKKTSLQKALDQLAERAGYNIVLDGSVGENAKASVTARFADLPLDTAVRLLADMTDLQAVQVENSLYVTTKEKAPNLEKEQQKRRAKPTEPEDDMPPVRALGRGARPDEATFAKLAKKVKFPGYEDPKMSLAEALEDLGKKYDLTFDINERAYVYEGIRDVGRTEIAWPNPIPELNVPLEAVLKKVLARIPVPSGATWIIRRDQIEITTHTFLHAEIWGERPAGPFLPLVRASLENKSLEETLGELAEQARHNVVLNSVAAEKAKTNVTARFSNLPLDTAVRLLADMAELKVVSLENVLYVTTREKATALQEEQKKRYAKPPEPAPPNGAVRIGGFGTGLSIMDWLQKNGGK